jgi:glycosyltransferase involved in cell wall biosynthesis
VLAPEGGHPHPSTMPAPAPQSIVPGRVSVLIITYNQQRFVRETLASVQRQRWPDLEIVVADDGSTDGTADAIRQLAAGDPRIVPVLADRNRGIPSNFNAGLARCTGEFVAFLGGDDLMLPGKIETQVAHLRANPHQSSCVHDMEVFDDGTGERLYLHSERYGTPEGGVELELSTSWTFGLLGKQPKSLGSSQMVRAVAMPAHGFDTRLAHLNDWLHGIEVLRWGPRGYVREVLGRYRRHDRQVSWREESGTASLEELLMVLAIVTARYPDLASRADAVRKWLLFQRAFHRWDPPAMQADRDRQVRVEAGTLRWAYLVTTRALVADRRLLSAVRPLARALRALLGTRQARAAAGVDGR